MTFSRRKLLKSATLLGGTGLIGAVVYVATRGNNTAAALASNDDAYQKFDEGKGPLGAWMLTLTPDVPNPKSSTKAMIVINAGGTVVETNLVNPRVGMGAWKQTGGQTFDYIFLKQRSDAKGNNTGMVQILHRNTLNKTFDEFDGTANLTITDPKGNVVGRSTSIIHATRIEVPSK